MIIKPFRGWRPHPDLSSKIPSYPYDVVNSAEARELASGDEHTIAFDEEAYSLGLAGGYEFDTTSLRFTYSSMTTPNARQSTSTIARSHRS